MTIPQALDLALQHHQAGRLADAEALYRQILAAQPDHAGALHFLGVIAHQAGRHDLAADLIRQAIAIDPNNPFAHSNLAEACRALGRLDEAVAACQRALELKPGYPEALNNLGNTLRERGDLDSAAAACRRAIALHPHFAQAHNNLGAALAGQGRFDEAMAALRRALDIQPDYAEARNNLANALREQGRCGEAIAECRRALALSPGAPELHNTLGNTLREQGSLDGAVASYRRALQLRPDYPDAHTNLGIALKDRGDLDAAIAAFRDAMRCGSRAATAHSNLIYALHFHPGASHDSIARERERWNRRLSEPLARISARHPVGRPSARPLRIGYVSPDFRDHVIGRNLLPLFQHHDRGAFQILCYSGVLRSDSWTGAFRRHASQWRDTLGVADEALAAMVRQDGVDILVDLTQHMAGNRLAMFARRPAPVQASFAGYPESTGLEAIPYRISDRYLEAGLTAKRIQSSERVELIDSFWCYDPSCHDPRDAEVEINALPAMDSGHITFGCLNNFCKINGPMLRLWARVLAKAAGSRLLLLSTAGSHRQRALEALESEGLDTRGVEFIEPRPRREYLECYHRLDIVLDTFPYNGHTTSLDALWMGAPVVTLAGEAPVSRAGLSQLTHLGLPELAAHSEAEYVEIAANLAADLPRLARLRSTLRARMKASVLMDAPRFARGIETAYRSLWERWRSSQPPVPSNP